MGINVLWFVTYLVRHFIFYRGKDFKSNLRFIVVWGIAFVISFFLELYFFYFYKLLTVIFIVSAFFCRASYDPLPWEKDYTGLILKIIMRFTFWIIPPLYFIIIFFENLVINTSRHAADLYISGGFFILLLCSGIHMFIDSFRQKSLNPLYSYFELESGFRVIYYTETRNMVLYRNNEQITYYFIQVRDLIQVKEIAPVLVYFWKKTARKDVKINWIQKEIFTSSDFGDYLRYPLCQGTDGKVLSVTKNFMW